MDILITDSMLKEYLDTEATPAKIAECVSLCGPSIERVTKSGDETTYHVEVTTNRVDAASAFGLAREAAVILPQFGISAKLKKPKLQIQNEVKDNLTTKINIDRTLCERFLAFKLSDIQITDSPDFLKQRLTAIGQRPLNNVVDVTNYVMFMLGVPMHAFDADRLGNKIIVREAKKGEKFTTLDNKPHKTYGGEIVFDNGNGEIVDMPGIMGTENSIVTGETKNVLLVLEHMDPIKIRKASLQHEIRTMAATINEKDPDPNAMKSSLYMAVDLLAKYANAKHGSELFDWYPTERKQKNITISRENISQILGVEIKESQISKILEKLGFDVQWESNSAKITVPTWRVKDIEGEEDIAEEVARIYGYFNLPSNLPAGQIPAEHRSEKFAFEMRLKNLLKGWGGIETYTLSMVAEEDIKGKALKISNPLGSDGQYMRTSLTPSLIKAAKANTQEKDSFHLFEMANVYVPRKKDLPLERMTLSGIFSNTDYRHAKGVLEALGQELNISEDLKLEANAAYWTYEFDVETLFKLTKPFKRYAEIPKYPSQIEDITLTMSSERKTGEVIESIKTASTLITKVELKDTYQDFYTFRIHYQSPSKTLTNQEVEQERQLVLSVLRKLGLQVK